MLILYTVECAITEHMLDIEHGRGLSLNHSYQDIFSYKCDYGYERSLSIVQCQSDRSWSSVPTCIRK